MRTGVIKQEEFEHILAALTVPNRLAMEVSLCTGLRIGDVLNLRTVQLKERMTVREQKTGKTRRIRLPEPLFNRLMGICGKIYVFEGRLDYTKPRTRQAVFKDLKRAAKAFRIKENLAPHSARKIYAVAEYKRTGGNLKRVQQLLNHSDEAVTMLYAMADQLTKRKSTHSV